MGDYNVQARLEAGRGTEELHLRALEEEAHGSLDARHTCRVRVESNILHDLGEILGTSTQSRPESQTHESTASKPTFASSLASCLSALNCRTAAT